MKNPRPAYPYRSRAIGAVIGLAIAGAIGAVSIPFFVAHRDATSTCHDRSARAGVDVCPVTQSGSVPNP